MTQLRGWRALTNRLGATALSLCLLPALRAGADIPPPPDSPETKRVPVTVEIDWGVFADRVSRRHVVAPGDTLRSLAAKYLGDKARWKAIVDANPALAADPDHILVGATLDVPPLRALDAPAPAPTPTPTPAPTPTPEGGPPPPAPAPTPGPVPAEAAPLEPWYDAFWMEMHGSTNWTLDAPAIPDAIPAKYAAGGSLQLLPHAIAVQFRSDLERRQVGREHEASRHALTAWVRGDGLVNKDDPTVRAVSRFRLTGVKDRSITVERERLRYDASGALVTRVWPIPEPSELYDPRVQEALRKQQEALGKQREAGGAAPLPVPIPVPAPGVESPAPAPAPRTESDPPAMSGTLAIEPTPVRPAPEPAAKEGGGGGREPRVAPIVLVVASLVALALLGVVVALRRGARAATAALPPTPPAPPPTPSAPPPPTPPVTPPPAPPSSSAPPSD